MYRRQSFQTVGLPHSEISGSRPVGDSPELIAAIHVLLRLAAPRHPRMDPYSLDHIVLHFSFAINNKNPMEAKGFEPLTLGLQSRCSSQLSYAPKQANVKRDKRGVEKSFRVGSFTLRITS